MSVTDEQTPAPEEPVAPAAEEDVPTTKCRKCGTPMAADQDWCLECGAARPDRTGRRGLLGPTLSVGALTALLVAGAVAASYAALAPSHAPNSGTLVAQLPTVATTPATTTTAPATTSTIPVVPSTSATTPPAAKVTPTPVPSTTPTTAQTTTTNTTTTNTTTTNTTTTNTTTTPAAAQPILLDANAASDYNPYAFPTARFGDPSLAIDGDTSTDWTYQLDPATPDSVAVGLLIDLNTAQQLGTLELQTSTPGMAAEYYGANGNIVPASITASGWTHLASTPSTASDAKVTLLTGGKTFRWLLVWIRRAPTSGNPTQVAVSELVLYH